MINQEKINKIVSQKVDGKNCFSAVVCISRNEDIETFAAGGMMPESQYFIASVTKLYTASIVFKLKDLGMLNLQDKISKYLSADIMDNLHIYNGVDHSSEITIEHLLAHTSGLPDYFEQKGKNGRSIKDELLEGKDIKLGFEDILKISKELTPKFPPGKKGKAFYSDTNYQLLGKIIEVITKKQLEEVYKQFIWTPLDLQSTYLYSDLKDTRPVDIYYKNELIRIPKMMSSFGPDGGIVSTAEENMIFLKAYFDGKLFLKENFLLIKNWNSIFFPFKYGLGLQRFKFIGSYELLGHGGATGSFAYYCPSKNVYITGTLNQIANPSAPYQLILRILKHIK